ncbi:MAG: crossover junction endodeoxyribonuclease RuvC [Acidobacteria bacterium]|nr:crossover junction endodeoxyribonuclease RuvC [Acidobacteriota bacterium]
MRVLGIDCGSGATGYGVIETDGRSCQAVISGVILAKAHFSFPERLRQISEVLGQLIQTYSPDAVAVEDIFYSVNAKSALKLGQVRGVALLKAAEAGLPIHEYSPLEVKSSVVGYGRAEKSQVQHMVKVLLKLDHIPPEDAADALAVAICDAYHSRLAGALSLARSSTADRVTEHRSAIAHAGRKTTK